MYSRLRKIDAIIVVALIVVAGLFLYKAGYFSPENNIKFPERPGIDNTTEMPLETPLPPTSFIPSYRRDVSPEDEGAHFDKIRISREWWMYGAVFNDNSSDLKDWTVTISFNHMARGDLLGSLKPDLLVVSLHGPNGESYGGMINKQRYAGILNTGTLVASSPGVNVEFEDSWAEGEYPNWHVHAEDNDIDENRDIIIDLDYKANSLPLWTIGSRAFDKSESSIASYLFSGCEVTGTVKIDGQVYEIKGTGYHEHSWTPNAITKASINGWDWFHIALDNGWEIHTTNYLPMPQIISGKLTTINPFGTFLLTTDGGETYTELKNLDIQITRQDEQIFPFVKMPVDFSMTAKPSGNPLYLISQSLLYGTNTVIDFDVSVENSNNKVWKFPTYVGMKLGYCDVEGLLSWSDDDGEHQMEIKGIGSSWSMRALL